MKRFFFTFLLAFSFHLATAQTASPHASDQISSDNYLSKKEEFNQLLESNQLEEALDLAFRLGNFVLVNSDWNTSLYFYGQVEKLAIRLGDTEKLKDALAAHAHIYNAQGDHHKVLDYQQRLLQIYMKSGQPALICRQLSDVGNTFRNMSMLDSATFYLEKAALMLKDNEFTSSEQFLDVKAEVEVTMANLYTDLGDFDAALKNFLLALNNYQRRNKDLQAFHTLRYISHLFFDQKNLDKAEEYNRQALQLAGHLNLFIYKALVLSTLGDIKAAREDFETALDLYEQTLVIYAERNKTSSVAKTYHSIRHASFSDDQQKIFQKGSELLNVACSEVRKIAHNMMPGVISRFGLVPAIRDMCNAIDGEDLKVRFQAINFKRRLPENMAIHLYRIIQESLHNIVRHAQASEIVVQIACHEDTLHLTIEDNGIGFDPQNMEENLGFGLKSIQSRVDFLRGTFVIDSRPGHGATFGFTFPLTMQEV